MVLNDFFRKLLKTNDCSKLFLGPVELLLLIICLWPKHSNRVKNMALIIHTAGATLTLSGVAIFSLENAADFNKMVSGLCMLTVSLMAYSKTLFVWYKSNEIKLIFQTIMDEFWPYDIIEGVSRRSIITFVKYSNLAFTTCAFTAIIYSMLISVGPIFTNTKNLPLSSQYPYDWWTMSPIYEILYIHQILFFSITVACGAFTAIVVIMGFFLSISSQYCILRECLTLFNTKKMFALNEKMRIIFKDRLYERYDEKKEFFVRCVKHHCMLLRITKMVNGVVNQMELVQLFSTCLTVGLGMFQFMVELHLSGVNHLYTQCFPEILMKKLKISGNLAGHSIDPCFRIYFWLTIVQNMIRLLVEKNCISPPSPNQIWHLLDLVSFVKQKYKMTFFPQKQISIFEIANSFLYMFGNTLQVFMDCFLGSHLYSEASLLPDALFHSKWMELEDEKLKNDIKFFLLHCQRFPQISVYNMYDINMISFVKVIKLAFSVYTLMSKLTE